MQNFVNLCCVLVTVCHVCICAANSIFVDAAPVGFYFFWGICVLVLLAALTFVDLRGHSICECLCWGIWWRHRDASLFPLSRTSSVPQSLGKVIWLGTGY